MKKGMLNSDFLPAEVTVHLIKLKSALFWRESYFQKNQIFDHLFIKFVTISLILWSYVPVTHARHSEISLPFTQILQIVISISEVLNPRS